MAMHLLRAPWAPLPPGDYPTDALFVPSEAEAAAWEAVYRRCRDSLDWPEFGGDDLRRLRFHVWLRDVLLFEEWMGDVPGRLVPVD